MEKKKLLPLRQPTIERNVFDENLIEIEYYHNMEFDVVWYRSTVHDEYVLSSGLPLGPLAIKHVAGDHVRVPTKFYTPIAFDKGHAGDRTRQVATVQMNMISNFGDAKGQRNTLPSAPEAKVNGRKIRI